MTVIDFDPVDRFVAGTVGPPGQRAFFLQARGAVGTRSVSLEKLQVSMMADRIEELLSRGGAAETAGVVDNEPLDMPLEDDFRVSAIALTWDGERERIIVECHDHDPDEVSTEDGGASMRVVLTAPQAREFVRRSGSLVAAGRPPCPFCGGPLDPTGHICPRANGYRR
jgi:uncharacterized repeat protein (TIGR03847 family)